jgi:tetratricopeptide (TPR) repeat protein
MDSKRTKRFDGRWRTATLPVLVATAIAAGAPPSAAAPPSRLECHVRSELAEARGDDRKAIAWAVSLVTLDPHSSYAMSRVASLYEGSGDDSAALDWGERALAVDSMNSEAAMLVGRVSCLAGEPARAAAALTPPLRRSGAAPELYALRALAHELDRDYRAALADLKRTGPLLPDFEWIATGILGMALEDGRLGEAYSAFQLAMELRPNDARTLTLGVSLAQRLRNPALERTLLRALRQSELP